MRFNPSEEIDAIEAQVLIREIVTEGTLIISRHAKERMLLRGYSTHDVEHILLHGKVIKKEFKTTTSTWVYTVSGDDLDGEAGSLVTAIIKRSSCVVITVLS